MEITLTDVKSFLGSLGLTWNGEIVDSNKTIIALDFDELGGGFFEPTGIKVYKGNKPLYINVVISETAFTFYKKASYVSDIDLTYDYDVLKDCTDNWIGFLVQKYGESYRNYANEVCSIMKESDMDKAKKELDELKLRKAEIIHESQERLKHYQHLERVINQSYDFNK